MKKRGGNACRPCFSHSVVALLGLASALLFRVLAVVLVLVLVLVVALVAVVIVFA